jgi:hypothetical protein
LLPALRACEKTHKNPNTLLKEGDRMDVLKTIDIANNLWNMQKQSEAFRIISDLLIKYEGCFQAYGLLANWFMERQDWKRAAAAYYRAKINGMPNTIIRDVIWADEGPMYTMINLHTMIEEKHNMSLTELFKGYC